MKKPYILTFHQYLKKEEEAFPPHDSGMSCSIRSLYCEDFFVALVTILLQKLLIALCSYLLTARPTLWDIDFANQLSSVTNQMPRNGLEEIIQWTKEGKMWQYPINNEDGEY